jgi:hypothetical protein
LSETWNGIRAGSALGPGMASGVVLGAGPGEWDHQVWVLVGGRHGCWRSGAVPLVQGLVLSDTWLVTCDLASSQVVLVKMQKRQSPEHWRTACKNLVHLLWRRASVALPVSVDMVRIIVPSLTIPPSLAWFGSALRLAAPPSRTCSLHLSPLFYARKTTRFGRRCGYC